MYKLRIRLDTDGDFGHNCDTVNNDRPEVNIYYNSRALAIIKLRMFYSVLAKTVHTDKDYMFDVTNAIIKFKEYLELIKDKYNTFSIDFRIGNPTFEIELIEVNPKAITGGGTILEEKTPNLTMYLTPSFETDFNWNAIKDLPSIEEGESNNETI